MASGDDAVGWADWYGSVRLPELNRIVLQRLFGGAKDHLVNSIWRDLKEALDELRLAPYIFTT